MKYLKSYKIFELNVIKTGGYGFGDDLDSMETEFLDKVKKERPEEYAKYLSYIKNKKTKGFWYAKNKYHDTRTKSKSEINSENRQKIRDDEADNIRADQEHVKSLMPSNEIMANMVAKNLGPYNELMKKLCFDSSVYEDMELDPTIMFDQDKGLKYGGVYRNSKRSYLSSHIQREYSQFNNYEGVFKFLEELLQKNPDTNVDKLKKLKPITIENTDIIGDELGFIWLNSEMKFYFHASKYAVSTQIILDINLGTSISRYNNTIFKSIKKTGNLKRGVINAPIEITKEDVLECLQNTFDELNNTIMVKTLQSIYNMKQVINGIFTALLNKGDFKILKYAKKYPILMDKLKYVRDNDSIDMGLEMSDLGF